MTSKQPKIGPLTNNKTAPHSVSSKVNSGSKNKDVQQTDELLQPHWTRMASKKHPGKYYYFNTITKESIWEQRDTTDALVAEKYIIRNIKSSKEKSPSKSEKVVQLKTDPAQFKKKNIAKDRLEKLQKQLELERKQNAVKTKLISESIGKDVIKPDCSKEKISIQTFPAKEIKPTKKEPPLLKKRKLVEAGNSFESSSSSSKSNIPCPKSKADSHIVTPKNEASKMGQVEKIPENPQEESKPNKIFKSFKIPKNSNKIPVLSSVFVDLQKLNDNKTARSQSLRTATAKSKPPKEPLQKQLVEPALESTKSFSPHGETSPLPRTKHTFTSTPKVQTLIRTGVDSPGFVNSPANDRLSEIRDKLAQEVTEKKILLDDDAEMTDLSDALLQDNSLCLETEAMDWEDIPEDVAIQEVVAVRRQPISTDYALDETVPGYGTQLFEHTHLQRFILLVMDTNIFLSHLKGVEQLLEKGFPQIGQPILIVPYIVLQELDRIKHREQGKSLSLVAAHSIRFLNNHLKRRDPRVKGQSAIEAANQLIPVDNADDNIINCCLQVRQIIAEFPTDLMLLSNDVNLRNKALVNGVQAYGYTDLLAEADRIRLAAQEQLAAR